MNTKHGTKGTKNGNQGNKGKGRAPAGKRVATAAPAPEPIVEDEAPVAATEAPAPADAAPIAEGTPEAGPTPKRKRDMSTAELQAEYLDVVGRVTTSTNRGYLYWKMAQARKGRITVGAIERRPPKPAGAMQVLPLGLLRETTRLLDAAVKAAGVKSRSAFIRAALIEKLRAIAGPDAAAAADALAGEAG